MEVNSDAGTIGRFDAQSIYKACVDNQPSLGSIPTAEANSVVELALAQIVSLEQVAKENYPVPKITPGVANSVGILWDLSGPGTYDLPFKDDRYKDLPWARGMDRLRLNYTALIARKMAELRSGESHSGPLDSIQERKETIKKMLAEFGPYIFYNGTDEENDTVEEVLERKGIVIPKEKVRIIGERVMNSIDQVRGFTIPKDVILEGDEIGIVSHAPHLIRVAHILNRYKPVEGAKFRFFPLPTPDEGREEYIRMEIQGLLYYAFLSPDREASVDPYPFKTINYE